MKNLMVMLLAGLLMMSCSEKTTFSESEGTEILSSALNLPEEAYNYSRINLPRHFTEMEALRADNTPNDNAVSDWGATLGRVLFYDKNLSQNRSISCASCHSQQAGFTDPAQFSTGFAGGLTGRNSMGLANAKYYQNMHFFWDERANTLEDQVLGPIQDAVEMGMTLEEVITRVEGEAHYAVLFERAFGNSDVSSDRISKALAQFVRSMVSYQAPYDEGRARVNNPRDNFPNFSAQQNLGKRLFFGEAGCARCHESDLFIADQARNIGLALDYADNGLGGHTGNPNDNGKFKVPSLRNISVTGPYMHDGSLVGLRAVVDFYNEGIQAHPNLDNRLENQNGQPRRLNLNENEKSALVAFLNTLTDETFLTDPKFSDPFILP